MRRAQKFGVCVPSAHADGDGIRGGPGVIRGDPSITGHAFKDPVDTPAGAFSEAYEFDDVDK
jgi:hypothetical protein